MKAVLVNFSASSYSSPCFASLSWCLFQVAFFLKRSPHPHTGGGGAAMGRGRVFGVGCATAQPSVSSASGPKLPFPGEIGWFGQGRDPKPTPITIPQTQLSADFFLRLSFHSLPFSFPGLSPMFEPPQLFRPRGIFFRFSLAAAQRSPAEEAACPGLRRAPRARLRGRGLERHQRAALRELRVRAVRGGGGPRDGRGPRRRPLTPLPTTSVTAIP